MNLALSNLALREAKHRLRQLENKARVERAQAARAAREAEVARFRRDGTLECVARVLGLVDPVEVHALERRRQQCAQHARARRSGARPLPSGQWLLANGWHVEGLKHATHVLTRSQPRSTRHE